MSVRAVTDGLGPGPAVPELVIVIDCALPLSAAVDDLLPVMRRGDLAGFQQIFSRLHREGRGLPPDELTAAVGELAPVLARRPEGVFARLALTAGAFVEWGGSALPLAASAPACTLVTMLLRARFSELWPAASGGRPEPDLEQAPGMDEVIGVFAGAAGRLGLSERQATSIALAWFDVGHWVNLMITVMARREFRDAADLLPQIGDAAAGLGDRVPRARWLPGLAQENVTRADTPGVRARDRGNPPEPRSLIRESARPRRGWRPAPPPRRGRARRNWPAPARRSSARTRSGTGRYRPRPAASRSRRACPAAAAP
jgi:hypothetical protein